MACFSSPAPGWLLGSHTVVLVDLLEIHNDEVSCCVCRARKKTNNDLTTTRPIALGHQRTTVRNQITAQQEPDRLGNRSRAKPEAGLRGRQALARKFLEGIPSAKLHHELRGCMYNTDHQGGVAAARCGSGDVWKRCARGLQPLSTRVDPWVAALPVPVGYEQNGVRGGDTGVKYASASAPLPHLAAAKPRRCHTSPLPPGVRRATRSI
jgi:hypothetical protein